jgi:hypothetical protein
VRKSAAKLIGEIAASFKDQHAQIVKAFALPLSERLIERVDECKVEIF